MDQQIMFDICQLFISFMSAGCGIALIFYLTEWVVTLLLSFVFPTRYGVR